MVKLSGLLIACFALLPPASAFAAEMQAEDCTAAVRDTPTLDRAKLPDARFRMVNSEIGFQRGVLGEEITLKLLQGEETATLSGGVKLRVILGACEDYSNRYQFELTDLTPVNDTRHWLNRASNLIAEVAPANREGFVRLPRLSRALAGAARSSTSDLTQGFEGQMAGGHDYSVTVVRAGQVTIVSVSYIIRL